METRGGGWEEETNAKQNKVGEKDLRGRNMQQGQPDTAGSNLYT